MEAEYETFKTEAAILGMAVKSILTTREMRAQHQSQDVVPTIKY